MRRVHVRVQTAAVGRASGLNEPVRRRGAQADPAVDGISIPLDSTASGYPCSHEVGLQAHDAGVTLGQHDGVAFLVLFQSSLCSTLLTKLLNDNFG